VTGQKPSTKRQAKSKKPPQVGKLPSVPMRKMVEIKSVGRHARTHYDPVTGRKKEAS
jgi:hypothetical protein